MKLTEISITNCRSIENAVLDGLGPLNVLIGRNNAGKSAFFRALWHLSQRLQGADAPWERTLRNADRQLEFGVTIQCVLSGEERETFCRTALGWGVPEPNRLGALVSSPLLRRAEFRFATVLGEPDTVHLMSTRITAEDGSWVRVQEVIGEHRATNPICRATQFQTLDPGRPLTAVAIAGAPKQEFRRQIGEWRISTEVRDYLQRLMALHLVNSFFFQPARRSEDVQIAHATNRLAPDGSNLPQELLRVRANHDDQFAAIVRFIEGAVPDIGRLQTPMTGNQTRVAFRQDGFVSPIPLLDMGTGIQQLLMMALLLETTGEDTSLFIEEPELNLHPGAQRFLLDRLIKERRQIFLTTHSSVFIDIHKPNSIYKIELTQAHTSAQRVQKADDLAEALRTIGIQNSDVLLSDAVLFVEGSSDQEIFSTWADTLYIPFPRRHINLLPLGGAGGGSGALRMRREVLEGISRAAPIPHVFIIDRDERTDLELQEYASALGDHIEILERRELENYLLVPSAVERAVRELLQMQSLAIPDDLTPQAVSAEIISAANSFQGVILLKRVWAATARMPGGPFPRELLCALAGHEDDAHLAAQISERISTRFREWVESRDLQVVVVRERERLAAELRVDANVVLKIAPGSDILTKVFSRYGLQYKKLTHGSRIASFMQAGDMDEQIMRILKWEP